MIRAIIREPLSVDVLLQRWHSRCSPPKRVMTETTTARPSRMWAAMRSADARLDKKRTVLLLRSVVIFTTSYLVLFGSHANITSGLIYAAVLVASNIGLAVMPPRLFNATSFAPALLLGDTALVVIGLFLTVGFSQEFLIVYFFTIFLTTAAETVGQIAVGATLVSGLYGYWLYLSTDGQLDPSHWLRLPFFFVVAIFYAFLTDELKVEKRRRQEAEREREHLRLLLQVAGSMSQSSVSSECIKSIGKLIEDAVPHLRCEVSAEPTPRGVDRDTVWLPIEAYGQRFGSVILRSNTGTVSANEQALAQLVMHAVASAAYTAQQVEVAQTASRLKEEFLATLSHELRTPLHAILGYSDLIESAAESLRDSLILESVGRLRANTRHLHDLLEEMMGFAVLKAGHVTTNVVPLDIPRFVGELAALTKELLSGRPIEFELDLSVNLPVVVTDAHKLRQVLASLLSNAVKFTERGYVRLAVAARGSDQIAFSVSDTGIGIAEEDVRVIFDDFRQIDGSSTRRFGGVGLGLALARNILALLGGRLEVASEVGRGSTFHAIIPFAATDITRANLPVRTSAVVEPSRVREPEAQWASL